MQRRGQGLALTVHLRSSPAPRVTIDHAGAIDALWAAPSPGTLVDTVGDRPSAVIRRFTRAFWHVQQGGRYVVAAPSREAARAVHAAIQRLAQAEQPDGIRVRPRLRRELRRAIGSVRRTGRSVVVEKVGPSLLKVGETETDLVPRRTGTSVEVLERRGAERWGPQRRVVHVGPNPVEPLDTMPVPAAEVRRYDGAITLHEGMVVTSADTVLPESFKWFDRQPLENSKLRDITPRFARLRDAPTREVERLPGSFYLFEYKNSGHYGHLLTEGVAKLWGWERARRDDPTVRLAVRRHRRDRGREVVRPDVAILAAYGIDPADVTWLEEPVRVERLYAATPQLHNKEPFSVDPRIVEVWDRLLAGLLAQTSGPGGARRMFVTRRSGHRLCHNWRDVESIFTDAGFVITEPSRLSLPDRRGPFATPR